MDEDVRGSAGMAPQTWKSGARCSPRQDDRSCQGSVSWPAARARNDDVSPARVPWHDLSTWRDMRTGQGNTIRRSNVTFQGVMTSHDRMISRAALCRHINMASRRETGDRQRRGGGRYAGQLGWRTGAAADVIGICMRGEVQSQLRVTGSGVRAFEEHTCEVPPNHLSGGHRSSDASVNQIYIYIYIYIYVNRRIPFRLR